MSSDHLSDVFFYDLPLPHSVRAGIAACGFVRATPVQAMTLPYLLAGRDVAAQAQTGTGKTAAFLISVLSRLVHDGRAGLGRPGKERPKTPLPRNPRALMIAPTRELAVQIQEDAKALGHFVAPRIVTVFGGMDYNKQRDQLRDGCDILIGTPGRLLDYEDQGVTSFGDVRSVVIDEADRLLDIGFIRDLRRILRHCPPPEKRHSMLFSATLSVRVMELAYEHMNDAVKVEIRPDQITADRVTQVLYHVSTREKLSLLIGLLAREGAARTLLFVNTKRFAEHLVRKLEKHGYRVGALTGDIQQAKRLRILNEFKSGKLPLLVATDVASRGLHIEGVTHVVNVDLPQDPEDYVHRIGRTARAGQSGKAISLACEDYVFSLDAIQRLIGAKIPTAYADDSLFLPVEPPPQKKLPPLSSGGPRHLEPEAEVPEPEVEIEPEIEPEPPPPIVAPPPPTSIVEHAVVDGPDGEAAAPEELPHEPALGSDADFWMREAFGFTLPDGGFGVAVSASAPGKRKRRRRRKGTAGPPAPDTTPARETPSGRAESPDV